MLSKVHLLPHLWRSFGPEWIAFRAAYAAQSRTGVLYRRTPPAQWEDFPLTRCLRDATLADPAQYLQYRMTHAPAFFFAPAQQPEFQSYLANWDTTEITPQTLADALAQGKLRYFEKTFAETGFPPNWHKNPFTGQTTPTDRHWSQLPDFGFGDIKIIWEPSRFAFAYTMVRAYWRTLDNRYAEYFWQLVEDWAANNPPNQGANWKCGQEISFRVMAWCFGLYGFLQAPATTPARVALLSRLMYVSGKRIKANIQYALSQRNNHGISEGVGLWTIGLLFPELRSAEQWKEAGRKVLEAQGRELIYDDGAFSQHSVNYHRVMLHDYLWAIRLGDILNTPLSKELKHRIGKATDFLYQLQDDVSGCLPNYGQNDGALILPLSNCDYRDFRPVIQSSQYLSFQKRCYENGPWDEDLLWMFGPTAIASPKQESPRVNLRAEIGGYYTLRSKSGFAFLRCANFQDRPGQADMLHVDLWWRGQNIALDAGTYSYNAPAPWNNSLAHTRFHNTVTVNDFDQMNRVGKFLWMPWLESNVKQIQHAEEVSYLVTTHNGYQPLNPSVEYQRGLIRLMDEGWVVLDRLSSTAENDYRVQWLLINVPYEQKDDTVLLNTDLGQYLVQLTCLSSQTPVSISAMRADATSPRGWQSPYYHYREPALSVDIKAKGKDALFFTFFGTNVVEVHFDPAKLQLHLSLASKKRFSIDLCNQHLIKSVNLE